MNVVGTVAEAVTVTVLTPVLESVLTAKKLGVVGSVTQEVPT
jgi:hypothetical protein